MKIKIAVTSYTNEGREFTRATVEVPGMTPYVTFVPKDDPQHDQRIIADALHSVAEDVRCRGLDIQKLFPIEVSFL